MNIKELIEHYLIATASPGLENERLVCSRNLKTLFKCKKGNKIYKECEIIRFDGKKEGANYV